MERVFQEVPYRYKNTLDAVPHLVPVSGEDADKNVQHIQQNICDRLEDVSNLLKYALEDRREEIAQSFPYSFNDLADVLKVEA